MTLTIGSKEFMNVMAKLDVTVTKDLLENWPNEEDFNIPFADTETGETSPPTYSEVEAEVNKVISYTML